VCAGRLCSADHTSFLTISAAETERALAAERDALHQLERDAESRVRVMEDREKLLAQQIEQASRPALVTHSSHRGGGQLLDQALPLSR
jgi:hypothetical protein